MTLYESTSTIQYAESPQLWSETSPAYFYFVAEVHWINRFCARLEVTDIEVRQSVIDEAVHAAVGAVLVLVDQPRDEVRGEGDDKCLRKRKRTLTHCPTSASRKWLVFLRLRVSKWQQVMYGPTS